jgi:5-methylcytosine-specific restriction endonuclease McrA
VPQKDPEQRRAYQQAYKAAHRAQINAQNRESYARHRDDILGRRAARQASETAEQRAQRRERDRGYAASYRARYGDRVRARYRRWRAANPERLRRYEATYRSRHRDRIRARRATVAPELREQRNRQRRARRLAAAGAVTLHRRRLAAMTPAERRAYDRAYAAEYRQRHGPRLLAYWQAWAANHREVVRQAQRASYARHRVRRLARAAASRATRREELRARRRARYWADPDRFRAIAMARHARKRGATIGKIDYGAIIARDGGVCYLCGLPVSSADRSFDHLIPLSKGGPHVQWNLRLTHRLCNMRRNVTGPAQLLLPLE